MWSWARAATAAASAGVWRTRSSARASASTRPTGTRNPVSPSRTRTRTPAMSDATTGTPAAKASMMARGVPSLYDGRASTSAVSSNRRKVSPEAGDLAGAGPTEPVREGRRRVASSTAHDHQPDAAAEQRQRRDEVVHALLAHHAPDEHDAEGVTHRPAGARGTRLRQRMHVDGVRHNAHPGGGDPQLQDRLALRVGQRQHTME